MVAKLEVRPDQFLKQHYIFFRKYFVERFAFEEPDISQAIKPSEILQKLAGTSPASPGSPSTKDVLNQQSQTPAPGGEKIGVKTNEPKPPTAESPGPEVAETAMKQQESMAKQENDRFTQSLKQLDLR